MKPTILVNLSGGRLLEVWRTDAKEKPKKPPGHDIHGACGAHGYLGHADLATHIKQFPRVTRVRVSGGGEQPFEINEQKK